jgi:hypothetical protein
MQSLADVLGVQDPIKPGEPVAPAPSPKLTAKAFCKDILNSREYRESIMRRVIMDELPPAIECMLWDRAHGKTVERVEVKDRTESLEDLTPELVAQKLERVQRMLMLLQNARRSEVEHEQTTTSVH